MAHRVYELTDEAKKQGMNWDEALEAYENEYCDPDLYGVE